MRPFRPGMQILGLICLGISLYYALIIYGAALESNVLILRSPATYIAAVAFVMGVLLLVLASRPRQGSAG